MNPVSRFMDEIPVSCMDSMGGADRYGAGKETAFHPKASQMGKGVHFRGKPQSALEAMQTMQRRQSAPSAKTSVPKDVIRPDITVKWSVGDKARHGKFGLGTVISVKGSGEETELKIAFPGQGVKGFTQKYAPIVKA